MDGAVDGNTPAMAYNYADGADGDDAKYVRLDNVVYPDGRTVYYNYPTSGVGKVLSRLDNIAADSSGASPYVRYTYLGVGTIVKEEHPGVSGGLTLSYNLDGSYGGWDRFGRIIEQDWRVNGSDVDHIDYTYDRNSNRTARTNPLASAYSESYAYDGLDRLVDADRNSIDLQSWNLDELGNWAETTIGTDDQTRAHNAANETGMISGDLDWVDPAYDAAGNMTRAPKPGAETTTPLCCTYDGWNRLVQVRVGGSVVGSYEYDAAGRRIEKTSGGDTLHYFWNENYQNIETRKNAESNPLEQWVFDIRYVDAPVVRFYDSNVDGDYLDAGDNTLYVVQDANFNVTAIVNASGSVVERYVYTPYGTRTVLDASFANPSSTSAYAQDRGPQGLVIDPETGLVYNRARYLHTSLGRFTIRDPKAYVDGMSLYQYERSNPQNRLDRTGLWGDDVHYGLTFELAKRAGIACAAELAAFDAGVDHDPTRSPVDRGIEGLVEQITGFLAGCFGGLGDFFDGYEKYSRGVALAARVAEWHFPTSADGRVHPNSEAATAKALAGLKKCSLLDFGEGLHVLQDSWSHQGKPYIDGIGHGRGAAQWVPVDSASPLVREDGKWPVRTAKLSGLDAALSSSADNVAFWNEDVVALGRVTYDLIRDFKKKCRCACPDNKPTGSGRTATRSDVWEYLATTYPKFNVVK